MSDKEMLNYAKVYRALTKTKAEISNDIEDQKRFEIIDWLIKQAERVEKLETQLSINTNNMKQLQKENVRYKQALEEIRGLYPLRNVGYQVSEIRKIVIKALEVTEK